MITASSAFNTANLVLYKTPLFLVQIAGYSRTFTSWETGVSGQYDWLSYVDDLAATVSDLDGSADLGVLSFTVVDEAGALTGDFPGFTFEGKQVTLKTGILGMSQADFVTLFSGEVDSVASSTAGSGQGSALGTYTFSCVDRNAGKLAQVIYTAGDDGLPTDSDHPKTLNAHPLDIMLDILLTQLGLDAGDVDSTKIGLYRDSVFSGVQFTFSLDSAPVAKDFIEQQLLKPLGGYMFTKSTGQRSVNFFYPLSSASVMSLTDDDLAEVPTATQADLINQVTMRFDKDPSGSTGSNSTGFLAESVQSYAASVAKYGQYGGRVIEADGLRSGLQGFLVAAMTSRLLFFRYGLKNIRMDSTMAIWKAVLLEPGDIMDVTCSLVPDRVAGTVGISSRKFEVLDRTWHFEDGTVELTLLDAAFLDKFGRFKISPDGEAVYASASTADKAKYMFMCSDSDVYSTGAAGNVLG